MSSADDVINEALPECKPGTIIYTAGYASIKQKSLEDKWITVSLGIANGGANGKDGITPKLQKTETAIQVSYDNGESFEDLVLLADIKGEKGDDGKAGAQGAAGTPGAKGADGVDGVSPTITTSNVEGGTKVTITDKSGEHEFTVLNGKDGSNGTNGTPGEKGTQGEKGVGVQGLTLKTDAEGKVTEGTLSLTDGTEVPITISPLEG